MALIFNLGTGTGTTTTSSFKTGGVIGNSCWGQVYLNDNPISSEYEFQQSYQTKDINYLNLKKGDLIQLYARSENPSNESLGFRNFQLRFKKKLIKIGNEDVLSEILLDFNNPPTNTLV